MPYFLRLYRYSFDLSGDCKLFNFSLWITFLMCPVYLSNYRQSFLNGNSSGIVLALMLSPHNILFQRNTFLHVL